MNRCIKPVVILAALVIGLALAPAARAQYRSYYYSTSTNTFTPSPFAPERLGPTPITVYASGAGTPVNFGTGRAIYYEPGYPTYFSAGKVVVTPPRDETSNYFSPTFSNRPSYTYTPGYYSPYYTPAHSSPTTTPATRYYRN